MDAGNEMEDKFKLILDEGEALRKDFLKGCGYRWYRHSAQNESYVRWKSGCLALVGAVFGPDSPYYLELAAAGKDRSARGAGSVFSIFLDTMKKARLEAAVPASPVKAGRPGDLLARAEGLARKGHYVSAVTLAGEVLEDLLRGLCEAHSVFCPANATLEAINDKLRAAGVYAPAWHRETARRISLRRMAELCYTEKINESNVLEMVSWLRDFLRMPFSRPGQARAAV